MDDSLLSRCSTRCLIIVVAAMAACVTSRSILTAEKASLPDTQHSLFNSLKLTNAAHIKDSTTDPGYFSAASLDENSFNKFQLKGIYKRLEEQLAPTTSPSTVTATSTMSTPSTHTKHMKLTTEASPPSTVNLNAKMSDKTCLDNGTEFLPGEIIRVGQTGSCCYFWYCDETGQSLYHEIPCFQAIADQSNVICQWKDGQYNAGDDILIEKVKGVCHGIHCTCDGHVIDLYGFQCEVPTAPPETNVAQNSMTSRTPVLVT